MSADAATADFASGIFSDARSRELITEIVRHVLAEGSQHIVGSGREQAERLLPAALLFLRDNTDKSPDELAAMARAIRFGGAHNGAYVVRYVREYVFFACPRLVAACLYAEWQGGKAGFQFLPDPAKTDPDEYGDLAYSLIEALEDGALDPRSVLLNGYENDLDFYNSLPERFTVYRGAGGISAEQAAAGVCWTTDRAWAEWFAGRALSTPVVVSARVSKSDVRLAFSNEHEVVVAPRRFRALKVQGTPRVRPQKWGPERTKEELAAISDQYDADDIKFREGL